MCGIAGCYNSDDQEAVRRMLEAQRHRGPDGCGLWLGPGVVLGHRRLAILDLTSAGHQPMPYAQGRLQLVFNGEIYNHRQLRQTLKDKGYTFTSQTDTEVVLAAYHAWGPQAISRLEGMFALALVDQMPPPGAPQLLLARDRLGIKPLLLAEHEKSLWFASELGALAQAPGFCREINRQAILDYLAWGSVQEPRTLFKGAQALPPGHCLAVSAAGRRLWRYWDLHENTTSLRARLRPIKAGAAALQLRSIFDQAVALHCVADVPVGVFLSGGIDSAAVASSMARACNRVHTFSVGFCGASPGAQDERLAAQHTARLLGTQHHDIQLGAGAGMAVFADLVRHTQQPSIDGANTYLAAKLAREHVGVALSGLGADELLAGYPHFAWLSSEARLARPLWAALQRHIPHWRLKAQVLRHSSVAQGMPLLRRLLSGAALTTALHRDWHETATAHSKGQEMAADGPQDGSADVIQQISYGECRRYLLSTLLRDADVMSMAHGLELRPVFLHDPLVEYAYALPAQHKLHHGLGKQVLRRALHDVLPAAVLKRPKSGFELPLQGWMQTSPLRRRLTGLLHTTNAHRLFSPTHLRQLRWGLAARRPPHALWAWGVLLAWLDDGGYAL